MQVLRGLTEGHQDYEQFWELAGRLIFEKGHAKDIATQMAGILALASVRTTGCRLATDNKKGARYRCDGWAGVGNSVCVSRFNPSLRAHPLYGCRV